MNSYPNAATPSTIQDNSYYDEAHIYIPPKNSLISKLFTQVIFILPMLLCIWIALLSLIAVHIMAEILKAMNPSGGLWDLNVISQFMLICMGFAKEEALSF